MRFCTWFTNCKAQPAVADLDGSSSTCKAIYWHSVLGPGLSRVTSRVHRSCQACSPQGLHCRLHSEYWQPLTHSPNPSSFSPGRNTYCCIDTGNVATAYGTTNCHCCPHPPRHTNEHAPPHTALECRFQPSAQPPNGSQSSSYKLFSNPSIRWGWGAPTAWPSSTAACSPSPV